MGRFFLGCIFKSAYDFIDFLADCGFKYWQVLPFCLPDEYNSPYKSYSAFSVNPYFIDIERLYDRELITRQELRDAKQKSPKACEFNRLAYERLPLLKKASTRFLETKRLEDFYALHPQTAKFCEFMALRYANGDKPWYEWTELTPNKDELHAWRVIEYLAIQQWLDIKEYANKKDVGIIGDIPIYVALDSSDVWANPQEFQLDERYRPTSVAGVPPDYFSEDGQLWGNPLYDWDKMKENNFFWWRERMSFMCELFDGVRIDHFRGLESYFSIPASEKTAKNGKWVKGPRMSLINAFKDICGDKLIIAEDLGEITPEVEKLVKDSTYPGMRVLQFGLLGEDNSMHLPHNYPNTV